MSEPEDPDVDLHVPAQRAELRHPAPVLAAISVGGALGAAARYGLGVAFPEVLPAFPWTTFAINVTGCLLIGVLMVVVSEVVPQGSPLRAPARGSGLGPLVRPFFGVGILGGYTTFSTYVVQADRLVGAGRPGLALAYLAGTVLVAVPAAWLGLTVTRAVVRGTGSGEPHSSAAGR